MKKVAFILNPISGTRRKNAIVKHICRVLEHKKGYVAEFYRTKAVRDAYRAAKEFVAKEFDIIVAIGGDGTVNEVAEGLIGSNAKLGIIPMGSGNGLARHLDIPLLYHRAVATLFEENTECIDAGMINGKVFFCTAGVGFDAVVGERFNSSGARGLMTYMEFCAKEYLKYTPEVYEIYVMGQKIKEKAFLITFANSSQWGNNALIAPDANISDGMMDVVVWRETPKVNMPILTAELFTGTIKYSEFIDTYRCKEIKIVREHEGLIQFDGESMLMGKELDLSVIPQAIKVIVPSGWAPLPQFMDMMPAQFIDFAATPFKEFVNKSLKGLTPDHIKELIPPPIKELKKQIKDIVPKLKDIVK